MLGLKYPAVGGCQSPHQFRHLSLLLTVIMTFRRQETGSFIYAESIISQHTPTSSKKVLNGAHGPCEELGGSTGLAWLLLSLAHALIYDRE